MILPTHLKRLTLPVLLSLALAGCGGGTSFGTADSTDTTEGTTGETTGETETSAEQVEVASLEISANSSILLSKGSNEVTISAVAKDKNNNLLPNAIMTFAVDNDATIVADSGNTTASVKKALLSSGMNHPESRAVVVTVTVGSLTKTLTVQIDSTPIAEGGADSTIVALDVSASESKLYSLGSNEVVLSVVAKNAANNVLSEVPVTFSVNNNALVSPHSGNDNADVKTAVLTSGLGHPEARTLTVTITSGSLVKTVTVDVVEGKDPVIEVDSKVTDLEISASSRQLFSDGVNPVVISAIAKDQNNNVLPSAMITFKVNNNATILPDATNSGSSVKTAKVTPGLNHPENRILDIEVMAGSLSKTLQLDIVGTTVSLEGPASIAINNPTSYTLKLQDSGNKALAFHNVQITSSEGSIITPVNGFITSATGEMTFTLTAAADGQDTITVDALGATTSKVVDVSGNDFSLDSATKEISIGNPETINMTWTKDGSPQANQTIQLSATRGVLSPATTVQTDANGEAVFTIQSDTAGGTVITATSSDGLSAILEREFIATIPHYINTQASPSVIAPHGVSSLIAKVRDVNDNPVKNQHIVFNLEDRVNGTLSSSQAVTDSLGRASVTYTASDVSSEKNGVVIKTYIQEEPSITDDITLTVGGSALRLVLGYDEKISESGIFYKKTYGVIVTDSAGRPVKDQAIDFTITPTTYYKGRIGLADTDNDGEADRWMLNDTATCPSEDLNGNGNLDNGEDANSNGRLEPSYDATITAAGVTDEEGKVTVSVVYPQNRSWWSNQLITAKAVVKGTEFVESTTFGLHMLTSDITNVEQTPPNYIPPYGSASDCSDKN